MITISRETHVVVHVLVAVGCVIFVWLIWHIALPTWLTPFDPAVHSHCEMPMPTSLAARNNRLPDVGASLLIHMHELLVAFRLLRPDSDNATLPNFQCVSTERIGIRIFEVPCFDPALKENVEFGVCLSLRFWKTEPHPYYAQEATPAPEKASFGAPIPSGWVDHTGGNDVVEDTHDIVKVPGQHNGLGPQSSR